MTLEVSNASVMVNDLAGDRYATDFVRGDGSFAFTTEIIWPIGGEPYISIPGKISEPDRIEAIVAFKRWAKDHPIRIGE